MSRLPALMIALMASTTLPAQPGNTWHNIEREIHYAPGGKDFIKVNGQRRFNRALYGTNTAFRVEAGDLPEFALYMPGMGGNCKIGVIAGNESKWITEAEQIAGTYRPGSMIYEIKDEILNKGTLVVTVLALAGAEGMVVKIETKNVPSQTELLLVYGGASGKKFSRSGDIGADPESSFYLQPGYCGDNRYSIRNNIFQLNYNKVKELTGVFPPTAVLRIGDAEAQQTPLALSGSSGSPAAPLVMGRMAVKKNGSYFMLVGKSGGEIITDDQLPGLFDKAEAARKLLAERVVVETPDPYINTLGGALAVAADAIWEAPSFLHGAVAWRMRLPAWRGAFVADPLGWHDRARLHFSSYALSQVTEPAAGPVVFDTALHLARQLEKMGTSMFSEGYICRNPNGDIRPHHYDMNLGFVDQLLNHFNWTGDTGYVREMWPLLERHLAWEKRNFDADNDGLYDAYACIWASDALQYSGGGVTHSSAYNYRANREVAKLAAIIGKDGSAYKAEADRIFKAIQHELWIPAGGWYAEYKDRLGARRVHPAAGVWTIYHSLDAKLPDMFQAYQALRYVDVNIPHIPVAAKGLDIKGLELISTTNWQPYTWSVNNVALAENLHTALAYWQGGRTEKAYRLWKSSLVESMYIGAGPGNFQQLSFYDAMRGELYRDFADPVGMAARTLVEGLFGVLPDALQDTLLIKPGFPEGWDHASLKTPDIRFAFKRTGATDRYEVNNSFEKKLSLHLQVPAIRDQIAAVTVNGMPATWNFTANISYPLLNIYAAPAPDFNIVIRWKGKVPEEIAGPDSIAVTGTLHLVPQRAEVIQVYDPQQVLMAPVLLPHSFKAGIRGTTGNHSFFLHLRQGVLNWWQPFNVYIRGLIENKDAVPAERQSLVNVSPVSLSRYFNDKVTHIFREQYLSPRPVYPTLQIPTQGIGNWCYPLTTAVIDDAGLRREAGANNVYSLPNGLRFSTPSDSVRNNIIFTALWDNYPDSVIIPLEGNARHAYFMMAGTTNPMQSQFVNGEISINYTDGTCSKLELKNPETWWPIEQDYLEDGYAFHLQQPAPIRVSLKTGHAYNPPLSKDQYTSIKGFSNQAIDGGAATVLDLPLDPSRQLKSLTLKATAQEVVIGLMGVSLLMNNP